MILFNLNRRNALAIAIATSLCSTHAAAQLEEVIVTAQKREESLQDTAIAITALSGEAFDELNISDSSDYEAIVPSLSVRDTPSRLFIRGVGRVTNSLGTEPGVAIYLDQIYSSEIGILGRASSLTTERLEVLRGPQGTLFGRNATGGAVSVTSKKPAEEFEHHVRAKAGNYGQFNVGASSSGPITDSLRYRVFAYSNSRDGYIDNSAGKDIWDQDTQGFGAQISWDISDTLNLWLSYQKDEVDNIGSGVNAGGFLITPYFTDLVTQDGFLLSAQYQWDKENPAVNDSYKVDMNDPLRTHNKGNNKYIAHLTWDLENVTVKYIGSYLEDQTTLENGDLDFTSNPDNRLVEGAAGITETYNHELQLLSAGDGPLQWVAGLYYYHGLKEQPYSIQSLEAEYLENTVPSLTFDPSLIEPNLFGRYQYWQLGDLKSESTAAYLDANYSFNESWKLTAGVRYSIDEKEGAEQQYVVADSLVYGIDYGTIPGFPANCCGWLITSPEEATRTLKDDWSNVSGRVVLDYMPTDHDLFYASISTGYKAGGFRLGTLQPNPSFDEEQVLSLEFGYKGTFSDTLRVNVAAYWYDYADMQVLVPRLTDENLPVEEIVNVDAAEVKGFEVEATWLASDALMFIANYSYIDGEYTDFCCAIDTIGAPELGEQDLSGNSLTQSPQNKIYLNAKYSWQTGSAGEFVLSGSYAWVDERQYDVFDTDATRADDYYRVDAMLTWYSPSENLRVILSGRNLTEEETFSNLQRLNSVGALNGFPNAPRTYGLEVQFDF